MHAYLIIAHEQFDLLESLLKCIDDARNDIYIHIDSRSELHGVLTVNGVETAAEPGVYEGEIIVRPLAASGELGQ